MQQNSIRGSLTGLVSSTCAWLASFEFAKISAALQFLSLCVGLAIGIVTLYRIFRHSDMTGLRDEIRDLRTSVQDIKEHGCTQKNCKQSNS